MSELRKPQPVPRRDFLGKAATWTCGAALVVTAGGIARLPFPAVITGEAGKIKIGRPDDFAPETVRWMPAARAFLFRDGEGFFAISGVCTHLGCIVSQSPTGFDCPCHGSKFGLQGEVKKGPAPSPLPWLEVAMAPDGQLVVDVQKQVSAGTKFHV